MDTINSKLYKEESISEVFPIFAGKFKFHDSIDVNPKTIQKVKQDDYLGGYSSIGLSDSFDVNGLEIYIDYDKSVQYTRFFEYDSTNYIYYPVYFVNSTNSKKVFFGKDRYVFGIQEARDKKEFGIWLPIESRGFDFCGNGHWGLIVHPKEYVVVLMKKYFGNYQTEMRVRFEVGENIFVSKPFTGRINEKQFSIKDSSFIQKELLETNGIAASWLFYGAVPKEEYWAGKSF
ncbi:MAG TPA: hypothetical protein PKD51_12535 [Saprospiraceae bacterium]|nr:hypothetical protein [Saprospiraceae bacterium]